MTTIHLVSYYMVAYDSTIYYGQLLDSKVWQYYTLYRGSYMSTHVLLNLLNKLGKR